MNLLQFSGGKALQFFCFVCTFMTSLPFCFIKIRQEPHCTNCFFLNILEIFLHQRIGPIPSVFLTARLCGMNALGVGTTGKMSTESFPCYLSFYWQGQGKIISVSYLNLKTFLSFFHFYFSYMKYSPGSLLFEICQKLGLRFLFPVSKADREGASSVKEVVFLLWFE